MSTCLVFYYIGQLGLVGFITSENFFKLSSTAVRFYLLAKCSVSLLNLVRDVDDSC